MEEDEERAPSRCTECRLLASLAAPSALVSCLRTAQMLTDQAVLGHLTFRGHATPIYLDAAALALLWMILTLSIFQRGIPNAINVLASQALGAGNKRLADLWLQTGALLSVVAAVVICGLWLATTPVVSLFASNQTLGVHQAMTAPGPTSGTSDSSSAVDASGAGDPVQLAGEYARYSVGYILPSLWMESISQWLLAQRIIRPQLAVYTVAFGLNLLLNLFFVYGVGGVGGLGFLGSPLATTATRCLQLLALLVCLPLSGIPLPRLELAEALQPARFRIFCAQMIPRSLSTALEEVALQAVGAQAGRLGAVETATHNSMLMAFFWLTSPLYGIGTATQQRLGYFLGQGRPRAARSIALLCFLVDFGLALLVAATLVLLRNDIGRLFSDEEEVVRMVAAITPLVAGAYSLIALFYAPMAILGGQGRPLPVVVAFMSGAFLVAPSMAFLLAFVVGCCGAIKLYGLWLGLICGYSITAVLAVCAVLCSDWTRLAKLARDRAEVQHDGPVDGAERAAAGGGVAACAVQQPQSDADADAVHAIRRDASPRLALGGAACEGMGAPLLSNEARGAGWPHLKAGHANGHANGNANANANANANGNANGNANANGQRSRVSTADAETWAEAD